MLTFYTVFVFTARQKPCALKVEDNPLILHFFFLSNMPINRFIEDQKKSGLFIHRIISYWFQGHPCQLNSKNWGELTFGTKNSLDFLFCFCLIDNRKTVLHFNIIFNFFVKGLYFEHIISFVQIPLHETSSRFERKNNNNNKAEKGILSAFCIGFFNAFVFSLLKKNYACAFTFFLWL